MRLEIRSPWVLSSRLQAPFFDPGATTLGRDHFGGGSDSELHSAVVNGA